MSDELDLLTRARDRLVELSEKSEGIDPPPWAVKAINVRAALVNDSSGQSVAFSRSEDVAAFEPPTAKLIVALRGCVPYLIEQLEWAINICRQPHRTCPVEADLARVILGETEGQNNE